MSEHTDPPLLLNGRYRLVEWLAETGTGTLYRAHDNTLERDVAIEFLNPELITHPDIVLSSDVGEQEGWTYRVLAHKEAAATVTPPARDAEILSPAPDDAASAVETERRRLAHLLRRDVLEALDLLLTQTRTYASTMAGDTRAHTAFSVLATLGHQVEQQVQDIVATLRPGVLETLGLEPALEAMARQLTRTRGVDVALDLQRLPARPSPSIELALYRAAQQAVDHAIELGQAAQMTMALVQEAGSLAFTLLDNGTAASRTATSSATDPFAEPRARIERLGGRLEAGLGSGGSFRTHIAFEVVAPADLTPREMDVIQLLVEGLSSKEIAQRLAIATTTVNYHLENIYDKLGVNSRTEAAITALRHGWVAR